MTKRSYELIMKSILRCQVHSEQIKAEMERNKVEDGILWKFKGDFDNALYDFRLRLLTLYDKVGK